MYYTVVEAQPNRHFKYVVDIYRMLEFHTARQWMSATYGFTQSIEKDLPDTNPHWAFLLSVTSYQIYLQGDEELSWFKIRYGDPQ
jgi:hypothetical protein